MSTAWSHSVKYVSHLLRGLVLAIAASSLTGCIVIPSGHRHYGPPRVAVEVQGRYSAPPPVYYERRGRRDDRRDRRYEDRYDPDPAGPRRY